MASGETVTAVTSTIPQLPNHKVKIKKPGQRACNEKNEKGKFCGGHLKRWFYAADVLEQECGCVEKAWGRDAEVYRCEFCQTLYLPSPLRSARGECCRDGPAFGIRANRSSQGREKGVETRLAASRELVGGGTSPLSALSLKANSTAGGVPAFACEHF